MRCDYQDLNDGEPRRFWSYGRVWLRRSGEWYQKRCGTLRLEWNIPAGHCGWGVRVGGGDDGRDFGVTVAFPFLATVYVTLERAFARQLFPWHFDRGSDREIKCYFHNWTFRYSIWVGTMASWSRSYPWCRWWRQGSFDFRRLLGKQTYARVTLKDRIPVVVPMPEGNYHGTAKVERATWKRPLWFATTRISTTIDCPNGIPFAGKGENAWDCGDDGLFGWSGEGDSVEHAIACGVESVLKSRRRHGMPSQAAIDSAAIPRNN